MIKQKLYEQKPGEIAKSLGLVYGGFGGWIDPETRQVKARTIDGKLVRVDEDEDSNEEENLGRLIVLDVDDQLLYADLKKPTQEVERYLHLLRALVKTGEDVVLMHARNSEKTLAQFLQKQGITAGPTLVPIGSGSPEKKHTFVKKKIQAGYSEILFFDRDAKAIHAVQSLKAPYNKREIRIDTHLIPPITPEAREKKTSDEQSGQAA